MPKIKKIKQIESKVKKIEVVEQAKVEDLEEEIDDEELEEFAEFVTGIQRDTSGGTSPVVTPSRSQDDDQLSQQTPQDEDFEEPAGLSYAPSRGGIYDSGARLYGQSSNEEAPSYSPSSSLPERTAPSATISGSMENIQTREITSSRRGIGNQADSPLRQDERMDKGYEVTEPERLRARKDDLHRKG